MSQSMIDHKVIPSPPELMAQLQRLPRALAPAPAPAPASPKIVVALRLNKTGWQCADVVLGTNTPISMIVDTGAAIGSVPQSVADNLISIGQATTIGKIISIFADGSEHPETVIDIGKLTIGGRTIYHHTSIGPDGSDPLLGINALSQFGRFSLDTKNNQLILGN